LQLNDVARLAGVGVAPVYRHFPTPEALLETVAAPGLEALAAHGERALADGDPWQALAGFLFAAIDAMLTDASIPPVHRRAGQRAIRHHGTQGQAAGPLRPAARPRPGRRDGAP
jgi:AcrR family transcriptional regulator